MGSILQNGFYRHQQKWWNLPNRVKCLITGVASGKTNIGSKRIIAISLDNAPIPILVISPSYAMARTTTWKTTIDLLTGKQRLLGRENFQFEVHKTHNEIRIHYKKREGNLWFRSADHPKSLRGPNVLACWLDKAALMQESVFHKAIARVRMKANKEEVLITSTPSDSLKWLYDICAGDRKPDF